MKKSPIILISAVLFSIFVLSIYPVASSEYKAYSCTIFTVEDGDNVYFGNNEDFYPRHMRAWIIPGSEGKYGKIMFGFMYYDVFVPLGGMNEEGLAADENALAKQVELKNTDKTDMYENDLIGIILEECSTVEEVIDWIDDYDLYTLDIYSYQIHFADKTGDAMILAIDEDGELNIIEKKGDFLVSTNFNLADDPEECWRYDTAEEMLEDVDDLDVDYCAEILDAVHLSLTRYSYICDLKKNNIYLYVNADFKHLVKLDLDDELAKGLHSYDTVSLVSQENGLPPNLILILSTYITLGAILVVCAFIWIHKVRPELNLKDERRTTEQGEEKTDNTQIIDESKENNKQFMKIMLAFITLLTVFTAFLKVVFIFNVPLIYLIAYLSFGAIFIFSIGVMYKPWTAFFMVTLGSVLGQWIFWLINGCGEELPAYLVFMIFSPGVSAGIISVFRQRGMKDFYAMVIGGIFLYWGLAISTGVWYMGILGFYIGYAPVLVMFPSLSVLLSVVFIPISLILNKGIRNLLKIEYLEELLQN